MELANGRDSWTVFQYDPKPVRQEPFFEEGVTSGYVVISQGDDALVASAAVLADSDGEVAIEVTSEFRHAHIGRD